MVSYTRDAIAILSCKLNPMADSSLTSERTHHWLRLVYFAGVEVAAKRTAEAAPPKILDKIWTKFLAPTR